MVLSEHPMYKEAEALLEGCKKRMIDHIEEVQQKQKACKIKKLIESKMAQEMKLNTELKTQLAEISKRCAKLDRICASGPTISDSDQNRLDNAKEMFVLGKHLTGIRFSYNAPPDVAKGYIKCEQRKALYTFKASGAAAPDRLWGLLRETCTPVATAKKNVKPKKMPRSD